MDLQKDIEKFLMNGGSITVCPQGKTDKKLSLSSYVLAHGSSLYHTGKGNIRNKEKYSPISGI